MLFETGPGNAWLVSPWARRAPHPRGGSYAIEVYQRLPNDTDFSILKTRDIPGLNFAPVGDSYAYHTARDTPERLSPRDGARHRRERRRDRHGAAEGRHHAADRRDAAFLRHRRHGRPQLRYAVALADLGAGAAARRDCLGAGHGDAVRDDGVLRWILTSLWGWLGAAARGDRDGRRDLAAARRRARSITRGTRARTGCSPAARRPASPSAGAMARLGRWLPARAHPAAASGADLERHAAGVDRAGRGCAVVCAGGGLSVDVPLLAAGILLVVAPPQQRSAASGSRRSSCSACRGDAVAARDRDLLRFIVAVFGRLPIVTPVFVYAAVMSAAGVDGRAAVHRGRRLRTAAAAAVARHRALPRGAGRHLRRRLLAPAYTNEQPLRRYVRALQDGDAPDRDVGSGVGRAGPRPRAGRAGRLDADRRRAAPASMPVGPLRLPVRVPHRRGPSLGPAAGDVAAFDDQAAGRRQPDVDLASSRASRACRSPSCCPPGSTPARSSLPGVSRLGRWTATFVAGPPKGIAWEASLRGAAGGSQDVSVAVTSAASRAARAGSACRRGCRRTPRSGRATPPGCCRRPPARLRRCRRYVKLRNGYGRLT